MDAVVEHKLDASVREDSEEGRKMALQEPSSSTSRVDMTDRLCETLERT